MIVQSNEGFPDSSVGKESICSTRGPGSIPGSGRSPGEGIRLSTPVFWPGEFHGLYSPRGCKESDTTEWLSQSNGSNIFVKKLEKSNTLIAKKE